MNREIMETILQKIKAYNRIMLFRHIRIDGDCVGATKGLKEIILQTWPEKEVWIVDEETSEYLAFLGPDDGPVPEDAYTEALGIALDTATADRISNRNYKLCKELIKIDHHIPVDVYGDYHWVEKERTSTCEMIVTFYDTFRDELKLTKDAAVYLFTGMVTDSGRFRYAGVSGDTMRCAGILLDKGIDTETLYARLYLESYDYLKVKALVYETMELTENGIAYIYLDRAMQEKYGLNRESAGACVDCMDSIRGCLGWMAFIETGDEQNSIRVRLRSRFMPINRLAEQYGGGGHAFASGATVYSKEEMQALLRDADMLSKEYKETHNDWL